MSKKTLGVVVIALAFLWSGAAFGQTISGEPCNDGNFQKQLTFPYLTSAGDWASGFAVTNLSNNNLTPENICFVMTTADGTTRSVLGSKTTGNNRLFPDTQAGRDGIKGLGIYAVTLDQIAAAANDDKWTNAQILSVFSKNADAVEVGELRGFGFVGDGTAGLGYLALNTASADLREGPGIVRNDLIGANVLNFDYAPSKDSGWTAGMAIANNSGNAVWIAIQIFYGDGTQAARVEQRIAAANMIVGPLAGTGGIFPDLNVKTGQAMRVVVTQLEGQGESNADPESGVLHGFLFFSDGTLGQGLLPVYGNR